MSMSYLPPYTISADPSGPSSLQACENVSRESLSLRVSLDVLRVVMMCQLKHFSVEKINQGTRKRTLFKTGCLDQGLSID